MFIVKDFQFDAAHNLPNHGGKCKNLHGHTYKLRIMIKGEVNQDGFVLDFGDLKKIVRENVLVKLDHTYLNDTIKQPTAENTIMWIWNELKDSLPLYEITLWETPTSFAVYRGGQDENQ